MMESREEKGKKAVGRVGGRGRREGEVHEGGMTSIKPTSATGLRYVYIKINK